MRLFGKKKEQPNPQGSIERLEQASKMLQQREQILEQQVNQQILEMKKKLAAKDRRGALHAAKLKKMYTDQMDKNAGARTQLETQIAILRNAVVQKEAWEAMKVGAGAMGAVYGNMTVDQVDDVKEDVREKMAVADEVANALAEPLGGDLDDDELLAELDEMEEEMMTDNLQAVEEDELPEIPTALPTPAMPAVPSKPVQIKPAPAAALSKEQAELDELSALMDS